jgi:PAS domain S-box-containing protein
MATPPDPTVLAGPPGLEMDESPSEREERIELALKSAEVGTWNWRMTTNFIVWDSMMHRLFGLEPGTFERNYEGFARLVHASDRDRVAAEVMASVEKDVPFSSQYRVVWPKDGSIHWIAARGKVYRNSAIQPVRMTGVCWDITEQKAMEEEIERAAADLKRSNKELEQFAYVSSHDLQEPLRMVTSYLQLLEKRYTDQLDAQANEFIGFAVDGAKRMSVLIHDLLAYSRIGTRKAAIAPVDMAVPVRLALENLKIAVAEKGADISVDAMPTIDGDAKQMTQLFQNLIGNALKFCTVAPARIQVSARRGDGEWIFSVADNGIGIEPQYRERIFVIFQRLHTREQYPGTGIGLAICKKIVEGRGGRIWVDSEYGKGATFSFSIPDLNGGRTADANPAQRLAEQ